MDVSVKISSQDVARAADEVRTAEQDWDRYQRRRVAPHEIDEAATNVRQGTEELKRQYSLRWRGVQLAFSVYWLISALRVASLGWAVASALAGGAALAASTVLLTWALSSRSAVLIGVGICFLLAASCMAGLLLRLPGTDVGAEVSRLRGRMSTRRANIALLRKRLADWTGHRATLGLVEASQERYENAVRKHARLVQALRDRRYQLLHSEWRSLRDVAFEDFVAEIFEELGYSVRRTKTTGDQGVDLIVTGKGRAIAVQTKGYKTSVGNKAVQEVYAGMAFYSLTECVVVTNSRFTSGALKLAKSVRCVLIDEFAIARLITGHSY